MLSLDVKSLFTNIPIEGALCCLEKRLRVFHYSDVEVKEFVNLIKVCISQTIFVFNAEYYKQSEDFSMGNPLYPTLSDIYMYYFEEKISNFFNFKCWMRYVDDTFILIEKSFDINHVLKVANSVDSHIQFIFELENSNTLPFLDVLVIKCNSSFKIVCLGNIFLFTAPLMLFQIILLIKKIVFFISMFIVLTIFVLILL